MNETTIKKRKKQKKAFKFRLCNVIKNITEYKHTGNGLRVLYARVSKSPTVTTALVYKVGSQHEHTGETGLSHMLEHMLFKPTSGNGVTWKNLEDCGALMNATTWLDRTLYYFTLPKEYIDDMLAVEADRMRNVIFSDATFLPERANVLSEYEMYNSQPEAALEWLITATAFQSHGYHHDTIGFKNDIERFTTQKLKMYYDRHYWPHNAVLIVAGDIPHNTLLNLVNKNFGSIVSKNKVGPNEERVEQPQEGIRRVDLVRSTPLRLISIAFRAPAFSNPDWTALTLALMYFTDGETSPLYRRLVESQYATNVEAHLYPTKDPFLAFLNVFATEKASYQKIEQIVFETIYEVKNTRISSKDVQLLIEKLYSEDIFSRDGSHAIATQLAEYVATGRWERYYEQLDELRSCTPKDIQRVVRTYLNGSCATIGTLNNNDNTV